MESWFNFKSFAPVPLFFVVEISMHPNLSDSTSELVTV